MNTIAINNFEQNVGIEQRFEVPAGLNVFEIAERFYENFVNLTAWVKAPAGYSEEWIEIRHEFWKFFRPKIDGVLKFGYCAHKGNLKKVFAIVAAVVIAVVAPYLAPVLSFLGPLALAASTAILTVGATLLSNALFPAGGGGSSSAAVSRSTTASAQLGTGTLGAKNETSAYINVESDQNVLAKESYLPFVAGVRRISLPEITQARAFIDPASALQTIHRIFALDGPHEISGLQVDGVSIEDNPAFKVQIIEGHENDPTSTFADKIVFAENISTELSNFSLSEKLLVDQDTPTNSEPRWEKFKTHYDPLLENILIRFNFGSMIQSTTAGVNVRLPVRIRFRERDSGAEWVNLPEIHFTGNDSSTILQEVSIRWDDQFGEADKPGKLSHRFFHTVPAATSGTLSGGGTDVQWQADAQFINGSGITDTANISGGQTGVRIQLDPAITPKAKFEFEIQRGYASKTADLNSNSYVYKNRVHSFFEAYSSGGWAISTEQSDFLARVQLEFSSSIVDRQPCQRPSTALVAIESKGQSIKNVTALCGLKVPVWDGEAWSGMEVTKNPAAHYRNAIVRHYEQTGTSIELIDNSAIAEWYVECEAKGYETSAVYAGTSILEIMSSIAESGFAIPAPGIGISIDWFKDRSADRPIQTFTPRNSSEITIAYSQGAKPMGIRAKFINEENNYSEDEIEVNNPFYTSFNVHEVQEYTSITNPDLVRRRSYFDMLQIHEQSRRTWSVKTATAGLACKKGDLVGVATDLLNDNAFGARVTEVISENTFRIDQNIPVQPTEDLYAIPDIYSVDDFLEIGEQTLVFLTTPDGTHQSTINAVDGNIIRIDDPIGTLNYDGVHVAIGNVSDFMKRCIVRQVTPLDQEKSQLILVDEAPKIHEQLTAKFG